MSFLKKNTFYIVTLIFSAFIYFFFLLFVFSAAEYGKKESNLQIKEKRLEECGIYVKIEGISRDNYNLNFTKFQPCGEDIEGRSWAISYKDLDRKLDLLTEKYCSLK